MQPRLTPQINDGICKMATQTNPHASLLDPHADKLRRIHTIPALVKYLDEELGWPIHVDDWEEAVYNWEAAKSIQNKAAPVSPTGATSLFDFDDDLDALAEASGAPRRPKSRATPAKAAGGKAPSGVAKAATPAAKLPTDISDEQAMCAIRHALAGVPAAGISREALIRAVARELAFVRTSPALKTLLDNAIRRAVRRGVAQNTGGLLSLPVRNMADYDRDHLKAQLLSALRAQGGICAKADAPMLLARFLGFARTGTSITASVKAILSSLVRAKQVESKAGLIRVLPTR